MGDVVVYFRSKNLRETAERELKKVEGIRSMKEVGEKALFIDFGGVLSPSLIIKELKTKGIEGVLSAL